MRRRIRRFKRKMPFYAFIMAIIAFALAFAFPQHDPEPVMRTPPVQSLAAMEPEPVLPDRIQGVEPDIPSAPAVSDAEDWMLTLVNPWNTLPKDYTFTVTQLKNGQSVDQRCYPDLQDMMDACRAAGLSPVICSSYRPWEKQEKLYQNKVDRLTAQGYSLETAKTEAAKEVAVPGTSEHQLGLALDIVDLNNQNLDSSQEDTAVQKWLMEHSWEYGFILRFPSGKSDITGIIYEPWHYRYVGKDAAKEIHESGVCLEEYLGKAEH